MKILIGICTRNRNSLLQKNLYSLRKLYIPKFVNLSILVVDNTKNAASNKLIKEFQKKKSFKIKIIYKVVKREGITTSRNQLLKMAKKINPKFMCFLDDDCTITKFWLLNNLKVIKETNCDVVTGPQVHLSNYAKKNYFNFLELLERTEKHKSNISWAATNNVIFKFDIINKLKIKFDEKMNLMGGSDQLFFRTIYSNGYKIVWNEKSKVYEHFHRERNNFKWFVKRNLRYGSSGVYIDKKVHGFFRGTILSFAKLLLYFAFALFYFLFSIIKKLFLYKSMMFFSRSIGRLNGIFGVKIKKYI